MARGTNYFRTWENFAINDYEVLSWLNFIMQPMAQVSICIWLRFRRPFRLDRKQTRSGLSLRSRTCQFEPADLAQVLVVSANREDPSSGFIPRVQTRWVRFVKQIWKIRENQTVSWGAKFSTHCILSEPISAASECHCCPRWLGCKNIGINFTAAATACRCTWRGNLWSVRRHNIQVQLWNGLHAKLVGQTAKERTYSHYSEAITIFMLTFLFIPRFDTLKVILGYLQGSSSTTNANQKWSFVINYPATFLTFFPDTFRPRRRWNKYAEY